MFLFVIAIIFIIAALILIGVGKVDGISVRGGGFGLIGLSLVLMVLSTFNVVDPGNVGIPTTVGSVGSSLSPGFHMTAPWTDIKEISTKTQEYTMSHKTAEGNKNGDDSVSVQTSDNAQLNIDSTALYHIDGVSAPNLFKKYGTDYAEKIVRPTIRSAMRDAATQYTATDLGTVNRGKYEADVFARIEKELAKYGITLESIKIRDIGLPQSVVDSINDKIKAQQNVSKAQIDLQTAAIDAQKKVVESKGTADAQQIVACGAHTEKINGKDTVVPNDREHCDQTQLTPEYLKYLYIQALNNMAKSPNHSTIIVPDGQNSNVLIQP